jgi:hypothetical protein
VLSITKLFRRLRKRVQIVHSDGHVTRCDAMLDALPPPFGMKHHLMVVVPPGEVVDEGLDTFVFDYIPAHTCVQIIYMTRAKQGK